MNPESAFIPHSEGVPVDVFDRRARAGYEKLLKEVEQDEQTRYAAGGRIDVDWLMKLDARLGVTPGETVTVTGMLFRETKQAGEYEPEFMHDASVQFDGVQEWDVPERASRIGYRFIRGAADGEPVDYYTPFGGMLELYRHTTVQHVIQDVMAEVNEEVETFAGMEHGKRLVHMRIRRGASWRFERMIQDKTNLEVASTRLFRMTYDADNDRPMLDWFDSIDLPGDSLAVAEGVLTQIDYLDEMLLEDAGLPDDGSFVFDRDALCMVIESGDDEELYLVPLANIVEATVRPEQA